MEKQNVAQVVFAPGTSESDVLEALRVLGQAVPVASEQVQEFNGEHGGPVISFP